MSGGGGGVIIIKPHLRTLAQTGAVQDNLPEPKKSRVLEILAKADQDWSADEVHFLLRAVGEAFDSAS